MKIKDLVPLITQEECAEVIQAISKVHRFGLESVHPDTQVSNKKALETEIGQLNYMLYRTIMEYNLNTGNISDAYKGKHNTFNKWNKLLPTEDDML